MGVHGDLTLCGIANQMFVIGERDIGWSCAISLIVRNDFYKIILPHTHTTKKNLNISTMKKI